MADGPILERLAATLRARVPDGDGLVYRVPGRWLDSDGNPAPIAVNPYQFWLDRLEWIRGWPAAPLTPGPVGGSWSERAVIYNLFVRSATAFDHDGDGRLGRPNADGLAETGTFLKSLALLPYIAALGCNTIHLLPITAVGRDGNKGDAGSPYAIRNPYQLAAHLAEPALGLGPDAEFAAFVAAAHHLGLRVVLEFVFRTASKDGDAVADHPEWFYWIDAAVPDRAPGSLDEGAYGMPVFTPEEAATIRDVAEAGGRTDLIPPHPAHREMFLPPPAPEQVRLVDGRWLATYPDGRQGRIPGAFADWPVDDPQPPWGDVTYLRLYDHPDFNYMAYNTIRMYDERLARPEHAVRPLWAYIANIIPHYQTQFGIDGAMIDMGHALPGELKEEMIAAARAIDPQFAFWDENFAVQAASRDEGYDAVMGSLPFILPDPANTSNYLRSLSHEGVPLHFFGALENHNTPRAAARSGGTTFVRYGAALAAMLPTLPFVHCGVEFGAEAPVNTGLDFTPAEIARYPSETLPLFSAVAYEWTGGAGELTAWWRRTLALRARHADVIGRLAPGSLGLVVSDDDAVYALLRMAADGAPRLALVFNQDLYAARTAVVYLPTGRTRLEDGYSGGWYELRDQHLQATLLPGACLWFEL